MSLDNILKIISLASIPVSLWALYVAYKVKNTAIETLGLNKQIYKDRQSNFSLYLNQAGYKRVAEGRILLFLLSVNNRSDSKDSFTARLEFSYKLPDNSSRKIKVEHNPKLMEKAGLPVEEAFDINPRVDERGTLTKWFCFAEAGTLPADYQNSKYTVLLTDSHGKHSHVDAYIANEL